jgi:ribonuclease R
MGATKKDVLSQLSRAHDGRFSLKDLAQRLKVRGKDEFRALRSIVDKLRDEGLLDSDDRGRLGYVRQRKAAGPSAPLRGRVVGVLAMTRRGFGFVKSGDSDEELYIAPKHLHTALHGDTVAVARFARPARREHGKEDQPEGEIVEVIKRSLTTVAGTLVESRTLRYVEPDDERIPRDITISGDDAPKARKGDKVVVRLQPWTDEHLNPEGTIIEVLGPSGDPRVEVTSVARSFGLPARFPAAVERDAARLPASIPNDEIRRRVDMRGVLCFTIDPEDAKDFDDAVSYEELPGGGARLGVHIADVSYYVREGTILDAEARERGTSVYLVNEVVPMLPERLSNDLCSLKPKTDRLTYSVFMDVDGEGTVRHTSIDKSIIHSARRFTYEEVQHIIAAGRGEFSAQILPLHRLAQSLLKHRRKSGSIDFDTGETKFRFDASGLPVQIIAKTRLDAHRLVEECMLLANKTVAEQYGKVRKETADRPFLYRVHDAPDPQRLADLSNFVKQFGYSLDVRSGVTSVALQKLLDKVEGSPEETVINEVALRSMAKAVYSEKNIGHYGLAFRCYTHFTSPIRRYPDLVVHRLMEQYQRGVDERLMAALRESLPEIARHASARERVAAEAERTSVKVMQVEYMKRHLGDEFDGVIGGVTSFGLFVEINELLVEGLVHVRELTDDYYLYDEKHYSLRGRTRGKIYRLGDAVRVRVVSVNPKERSIDLFLVE